jgi:hypothetical protein
MMKHRGWAANLIGALEQGESVTFVARGYSMEPRVKHKQRVTVRPLRPGEPKIGDIVLCKVRSWPYLHEVQAVRKGQKQNVYLIGNRRGKQNGWSRHIYGVLVENGDDDGEEKAQK